MPFCKSPARSMKYRILRNRAEQWQAERWGQILKTKIVRESFADGATAEA